MLTEDEMKVIIKAYSECGDFTWLETIQEIVISNKYLTDRDNILALLKTLFKINYVVIETETEDYASKYEMDIKDIYGRMKCDLMKRLNFEDFWEHI